MTMRTLLFILTTGFILILFGPAAAWASPSHYAVTGSGSPAVSGTGTIGQLGDPTVHVAADQTLSGSIGNFVISYPDGTYAYGPATCLFVAGNTAYLTGGIIAAAGPRQQALGWFAGRYIVIGVLDAGASISVNPDLVNFSPGFAVNPGCGPNVAAAPVFPITSGGFQVSGGS
jgi:hypothetical protein